MAVNGIHGAANFDGSEEDEVFRGMFRYHIAWQLDHQAFEPDDDDLESLELYGQFPRVITNAYQVPMTREHDTLYGPIFNIDEAVCMFERANGTKRSERLRLDFTLLPVREFLGEHAWFLDIVRQWGRALGSEAEATLAFFECPIYLRRTDAASHQAFRLFRDDYFFTAHPNLTRSHSKIVGVTVAAAFRLFAYLLSQNQKALLQPGVRAAPMGMILVRTGERHMLNFARLLTDLELFTITESIFGFCPFWAADLGPGPIYDLRPDNDPPAGAFASSPQAFLGTLSRPRALIPDSPFDALRIVFLPTDSPDGQWLEDTLLRHPSPRMQPRYIIQRVPSSEVAGNTYNMHPSRLFQLRFRVSTNSNGTINDNPVWPWPHGWENSQGNAV